MAMPSDLGFNLRLRVVFDGVSTLTKLRQVQTVRFVLMLEARVLEARMLSCPFEDGCHEFAKVFATGLHIHLQALS